MESSDEEGEILQYHVTNYHFEDGNRQLISFAALPLQWDEKEASHCGQEIQVYICGNADNGLQKIHKLVVAWRFELSYVQPEILVLSKDKSWMTLQKPRRAYLSTIGTTLTAVHWLHFLKRNPEASRDALWNHLQKVFRFFDINPSEGDLSDQMVLIGEAIKRDKDLHKYQDAIMSQEKPWKLPPLYQGDLQKTCQFLVDEHEDDDDLCEQLETSESIFDPVCAICDNGGSVLCCEGRCLRSFHPTKADGIDSLCDSLGLADQSEVDAMPEFLCKNCLYKQHQCYACGKLGSSDASSLQEVFACVSATCGHYYHPGCVSKWVYANNKSQAEKFAKEIVAGESFTCPVHQCFLCKKSENPEVYDQQFAVCRRCPKAYHRKCLPKCNIFICDRSITSGNEPNGLQRAWEGLLNFNRILIYCLDHEIDEGLATPVRNHLVFPHTGGKVKKWKLESPSSNKDAIVPKRNFLSGNMAPNAGVMQRTKSLSKLSNNVETNAYFKNKQKTLGHMSSSPRKLSLGGSTRKSLVGDTSSDHQMGFRADKGTLTMSKVKYGQEPVASKRFSALGTSKLRNADMMEKARIQGPSANEKMEQRVLAIIQDSVSSINAQEFMKRRRVSAASTYTSNVSVDKSITMGRVEASVKAVRTALQKLEAGGSVEDAKNVCGPEVLQQIFLWKTKLSIYLAPFLHGMRYTSFGRHFTKVDKLKEIVDRLHCYVQNGDTIVDFCCGSNDFSCLLKEKLEQTSKSCSFKNYDLFQPKNDFNFEKRDWMSVEVSELPEGSQLIMGLNPPFGYKASLANQFISKALKFRPKLLILIVPAETRRVDKKAAYDLIWKEDSLLAQKSFYLPGSVDVHEKQLEQWNLKAPPLYLWSRRDWTAQHMKIAREHGHLQNGQMVTDAKETMSSHSANDVAVAQEHGHLHTIQMATGGEGTMRSAGHWQLPATGDLDGGQLATGVRETMSSNYLMEEEHDCYFDFSGYVDACGGISSIFDDVPEPEPSSGCLNDIWKAEQTGKQDEVQYEERRQIETAAAYGFSPDGNDMCIDMEISPPSPPPTLRLSTRESHGVEAEAPQWSPFD